MRYKKDGFEAKLKAMYIDIAVPDALSPDNIHNLINTPEKNRVKMVRSKIMQIAAMLVLVIGVSTVAVQLFATRINGLKLMDQGSYSADSAVPYSTENDSTAGVEEASLEKNQDDVANIEAGTSVTESDVVVRSTKKNCLPECTENRCNLDCPNYDVADE